MVPSLTCTVEPEAGDARIGVSAEETGPGKGWRWEAGDVGPSGDGGPSERGWNKAFHRPHQ